jgi:thiamine biosynthesis lipoprotein
MYLLIRARFSILLASFVLLSFAPPEAKDFYIKGYAQGTTYSITYYAGSQKINKAAIDSIFGSLDQSLSIYKPQSLISTFNNSSSEVKTDKHLHTVVKKSLDIYQETNGKFDITVYPLVNAWGFGNEKIKQLPDSNKIKSILTCIGSDKLVIRKESLIKTIPCLKIDVNGIAQGYSVDVLAKYLEKKGIRDYLIEVGGELRVRGKKPNGELMKIGIESPAKHSFDEPVIGKTIRLKKGAITTSGSYRKFVTSEDHQKKLSHLIDPFSGYPLQGSLISVTVIAKDAITADGYDNALMAMSVEDALAFVEKKKGMEAYFIYLKPDGVVRDTATRGFGRYLVD